MKSSSGFVPTDRRRAWYRAELLELLGGNETLMNLVERAENDYLDLVGGATKGLETDRAIHDDLQALAEAIEVLQSIYNPGGSARALFEGEALRLVGGANVQNMRDLFSGVPGDALVMAARGALEQHQVPNGRPASPHKIVRHRLVAAIAAIAEQAGITVRRQDRAGDPSTFERLLEFVFDRTEIDTDNFKADTAIKYFLETRASSGAG